MILGNCLFSFKNESTPVPDEYITNAIISVSNTEATRIGEGAFASCRSLSSVDLPNVTQIENYAFNGCREITSISFPYAETIGYWSFLSCQKLASLNIPNVREIGEAAFRYCKVLGSITLPSCTKIGRLAFGNCKSGFVMHILSNSVCEAGQDIFDRTTVSAIYVPAALVDSYKAASQWSAYADKIFAEP